MSSASVPDDAIMLIAVGNWARSTRAGTEPKLAASNHTKAVPMPKRDCEDLCQRQRRAALPQPGRTTSSRAATPLQATIIFFRSARSANAPAISPKTRYGQVWRTSQRGDGGC